jgi:hypothetical protein
MIIIFVIFSFLTIRWSMKQFKTMTEEFEQRGFTMVAAEEANQPLEVTEKVTKPTLFVGKKVTLLEGAAVEVAIVAVEAELHGEFDGKVYFRGHGDLTVAKDAILKDGLDAQAKKVRVLGTVKGEITGEYDQLEDQRDEPDTSTTAAGYFR